MKAWQQWIGGGVLVAALLSTATAAPRVEGLLKSAVQAVTDRPQAVAVQGMAEVAFSPREGAENLVLKVIRSATKEIRILAYSFTSATVTQALLDAKHRGVDVALVVDEKASTGNDRSGKARSALAALTTAGCRVRVNGDYAIHHDKVIIVDRETVETGSFNFSAAAAQRNSENVIVLWRNPDLAAVYLAHWSDRFNEGREFATRY